MKSNEIKTEAIIKSLRVCCAGLDCVGCMFEPSAICDAQLMGLATDRLEQLSGKLKVANVENNLLKDHTEGKCVIAQYVDTKEQVVWENDAM